MTEPKHTPGPWYITEEDWEKTSKRDMVVIYDNDGEEVLGIIGSILVDEPDLQLMSAAPDMYEALEHLRIVAQKVCDDFCCGAGCCSDATDCHLEAGLIHAEIALRKARGEGV